MRKKKQVFLPGEIKCLMIQLLSAISHLHDNWILHRDLKSSNLLLSHNGILKVSQVILLYLVVTNWEEVSIWIVVPELLAVPYYLLTGWRFWSRSRIWLSSPRVHRNSCYPLVSRAGTFTRNQRILNCNRRLVLWMYIWRVVANESTVSRGIRGGWAQQNIQAFRWDKYLDLSFELAELQ